MKNLRIPVLRRRLSLELVDDGALSALGHVRFLHLVTIGRDEEGHDDEVIFLAVGKSITLDLQSQLAFITP
jgi:hypothetical protein